MWEPHQRRAVVPTANDRCGDFASIARSLLGCRLGEIPEAHDILRELTEHHVSAVVAKRGIGGHALNDAILVRLAEQELARSNGCPGAVAAGRASSRRRWPPLANIQIRLAHAIAEAEMLDTVRFLPPPLKVRHARFDMQHLSAFGHALGKRQNGFLEGCHWVLAGTGGSRVDGLGNGRIRFGQLWHRERCHQRVEVGRNFTEKALVQADVDPQDAVNIPRAEIALPTIGRCVPHIAQASGAIRHTLPKRLRKTHESSRIDAKRRKTRIREGDISKRTALSRSLSVGLQLRLLRG